MLAKDLAIERLADGIPDLSYDEIIGHPGFAAARKVHFDRFMELYDDDPFLVRLLIEAGRFFVYRTAIALEVSQDPDDPESHDDVCPHHHRFVHEESGASAAGGRAPDRLIFEMPLASYRPGERIVQ